MIQRIIRILNNASAPGLEWAGSVFSFPSVVQCAFWPNWSYMFRFKPAVITRVSVNYTPGGTPAFYHEADTDTGIGNEDNPPESVQITVDLLELEYWLKNDFKEIGASPIDVTASKEDRSNLIKTDESKISAVAPQTPLGGTGGVGDSTNVGVNVNQNFLDGIGGN